MELIGEPNATLRDALAAVPDGVDVTVDRPGPYPSDDVDALLTARQREVLATARELGYSDSPRRATHEEIADRIGLGVGTVTEHLRKIEARAFDHLTAQQNSSRANSSTVTVLGGRTEYSALVGHSGW